jgi:CTP synthase (UTP-ammonia lyase)
MGASMRLGLYKADLLAGSIVAQIYGSKEISERHRHRYEVNNLFRDKIAAAGMVFSGIYPIGASYGLALIQHLSSDACRWILWSQM